MNLHKDRIIEENSNQLNFQFHILALMPHHLKDDTKILVVLANCHLTFGNLIMIVSSSTKTRAGFVLIGNGLRSFRYISNQGAEM